MNFVVIFQTSESSAGSTAESTNGSSSTCSSGKYQSLTVSLSHVTAKSVFGVSDQPKAGCKTTEDSNFARILS